MRRRAMQNATLLAAISGLLDFPGLVPEARHLIELSIAAQKTGQMPSIAELQRAQQMEHLPPSLAQCLHCEQSEQFKHRSA